MERGNFKIAFMREEKQNSDKIEPIHWSAALRRVCNGAMDAAAIVFRGSVIGTTVAFSSNIRH